MSVEIPKQPKAFKRAGHPPKCPTCGTVLMRVSELADMLDMPHSTVALRLKRAGAIACSREGARDLYNVAVVLPILLEGETRHRW